ncbi:MAG: hypothetical protein Q4P31_06625 [Andreesenia angusta]|nr:hypothetical protein [Andreesenia angusta]
MDNLRKNVKIVFPIIVILQIITNAFAQKEALNTQQAKDMQAIMDQVDSPLSWMVNPSISTIIGITIVGTIIGIGIAYLICKAIYKRINSENNDLLKDFNKNHFSIMSFKYISLTIINLILIFFYKQEKIFVLTAILTAIVVMITLAGANLIFNNDKYKDIKTVPNLILYGIMAIF